MQHGQPLLEADGGGVGNYSDSHVEQYVHVNCKCNKNSSALIFAPKSQGFFQKSVLGQLLLENNCMKIFRPFPQVEFSILAFAFG
jgi:hypothetical protein